MKLRELIEIAKDLDLDLQLRFSFDSRAAGRGRRGYIQVIDLEESDQHKSLLVFRDQAHDGHKLLDKWEEVKCNITRIYATDDFNENTDKEQ